MRRALAFAVALPLAGCAGRTGGPAPVPAPAAPPAVAADPRALQYAADNGRYRIQNQTHIVQDIMGQSQERTTTLILTLTAALTRETAGLSGVFTIDSVALDSATASTPQAGDIQQVRGRSYRAVYSPSGRPVSLTAPDTSSPVVVQMGEMFREFLPALPPSTITAGMTWTDTTSLTTSPAPGLVVRSQSVRQHRVVGWEDHGGVRALHIATAGTYTLSGEGEQQGQQLQLSGAGSNSVDRFVSAAGIFLGQTLADSGNITVNVLSAGMEIPIRQTRRATVTRLP
jgi:hypothetical protein